MFEYCMQVHGIFIEKEGLAIEQLLIIDFILKE
jgi:hypothetical protein